MADETSKRISVHLEPELMEKLEAIAKKEDRKPAWQARVLLKEAIERHEKGGQ